MPVAKAFWRSLWRPHPIKVNCKILLSFIFILHFKKVPHQSPGTVSVCGMKTARAACPLPRLAIIFSIVPSNSDSERLADRPPDKHDRPPPSEQPFIDADANDLIWVGTAGAEWWTFLPSEQPFPMTKELTKTHRTGNIGMAELLRGCADVAGSESPPISMQRDIS
ncbi:MAG TPA: hypothetical protein VN222_09950 [Novosphingobium sp.]|nr:hypothetical protein [Novosphingobium sp.]